MNCINLCDIFLKLELQVEIDYLCNIKEFLYLREGKNKCVTRNDRELLEKCDRLVVFKLEKPMNAIKCFGIIMNSDIRNRNEDVIEISKCLRHMFGYKIIICFVVDESLAFTGNSVSPDGKIETVLSEWFSYKMKKEKSNKILEIVFSDFPIESPTQFYNDYVYSIARKYTKYKENKMYLTYGCDVIMHNVEINGQNNRKQNILSRIDCDETYAMNLAYYRNLYGDDYFIDEDSLLNDNYNEDDSDEDLKWTLLEMELEREEIKLEESDFQEEADEREFDNLTESYKNEIYESFNPMEILKVIQKKADSKTQ